MCASVYRPCGVLLVGCLSIGLAAPPALAQAKQKQTAKQPAASSAPKAAAVQPASDDAARKREILNSAQWRHMMYEFSEWLTVQPFYDAKQVEQLKAQFNERVARMPSAEVQQLLNDMLAKFQIVDSPEARDARAWVASYLAVMSDKKRAEVLKQLPNLATLSASQLQQELLQLEQKRASIDQQQAAFERSQQALVSQQVETDRAARQAYQRAQSQLPTTALSPYRSNGPAAKPFENAKMTGPQMDFYVSPWGGIGYMFHPSSW